jgi:hypothetical protein
MYVSFGDGLKMDYLINTYIYVNQYIIKIYNTL